MATGATMRAAAAAVLTHEPTKVVVAVPTASMAAVRLVAEKVDSVVCLETPSPFISVGRFYRNFGQTDDDEIRELLAESRASEWHTPTTGTGHALAIANASILEKQMRAGNWPWGSRWPSETPIWGSVVPFPFRRPHRI